MHHNGNIPSKQSLHGISPLISQTTAHVLSALFTVAYVLPFYLSRRTRPSPTLTRDAPNVIRARITLVSIACCVCASVTLGILFQRIDDDEERGGSRGHGHGHEFSGYGDGTDNFNIGEAGADASTSASIRGELSLTEAARLLGWWPVVLPDVARVMALTGILFAGPLFEAGVVEGGWRWWGRWDPVKRVLGTWIGVRNFIAGPLSEEFIFRSLILTLHVLSLSPSSSTDPTSATTTTTTTTTTITSPPISPPSVPLRFPLLLLLPPLYFAIAHIHHYYEFRLTHPHIGRGPALARSVLQLGYTSLFGAYAGFVFLRTGSLLAVVLAHTFCNWIGLPRFWGWVGEGDYGIDDDDDDDDEKEEVAGAGRVRARVKSDREKKVLTMTVVYYFLLVAGAVGFYVGLYPLTRSERATVRFEN